MGSGIELCFDNFEFEFSHVLWKVVIIADMGVSKPGSGFSGGVGIKEGGLKVFDEVGKVSKGGSIKGILCLDSCPTFGCSFGHEGEGISNLLVVSGIDIFVDQEVSPD